MDYKTAGDKLANYLNIQVPDLEGEIAEVMDKALNALDECAKRKHIVLDSNNHWLYTGELADLNKKTVLKAVRRAEDFDRELELFVYEAKEVACFNQDAIENELHIKDSKPIPIDELADEVVLPEMLVYPGDKLGLNFIVKKAHHADHRASKENVRLALNHLEG